MEELRELAQKKPVDFDAYDSQYLAPYIAFINDEHTLRDAVAAQETENPLVLLDIARGLAENKHDASVLKALIDSPVFAKPLGNYQLPEGNDYREAMSYQWSINNLGNQYIASIVHNASSEVLNHLLNKTAVREALISDPEALGILAYDIQQNPDREQAAQQTTALLSHADALAAIKNQVNTGTQYDEVGRWSSHKATIVDAVIKKFEQAHEAGQPQAVAEVKIDTTRKK